MPSVRLPRTPLTGLSLNLSAAGCVATRIAVVLVVIFGASSARAQSRVANGSIEGRVVSLTTGAPVGKAGVNLSLGMGPTLPGPRPSFPEVETDEKGCFAFRNLEPGMYSLFARRQGFLDPNPRSSGYYSVVLGETQALSGMVLKLMPEATIAVTATDSNGRPLGLAGVRILRDGYAADRRQFLTAGAGLTNASGECRIGNLPPGDYVVRVSAPPRPTPAPGQALPQGPVLTEVATYYPDATDPAAAAAIRLRPGEVRSVKIRLRKAPTVYLRGRVADSGAGDGTISLVLAPRIAVEQFPHLLTSQVGADGSFLITGVPVGAYYLVAERTLDRSTVQPISEGPAGLRTFRYIPGSRTRQAAAVRSLDVGDENADGITMKLEPVFHVSGTVTVEDGARCRFSGGIDSFTSILLRPEAPETGSIHQARISYDGFVLENLTSAPYSAYISTTRDCYVQSIRQGKREAADGVMEFRDDGPLEITFAMSETLEGRVVARDGKAPARATVTLLPRGGASPYIHSVQTGAGGSFTLRGMGPGSYNLFAWEEWFDDGPRIELLRRLPAAFAERALAVTVKKGPRSEGLRVEAVPAAQIAAAAGPSFTSPPVKAKGGIAGRVLDTPSGAPVAGVTLNLKGWREATPEASAVTDPQGRFQFRELEPGFYNLSAEHPGFARATYGRGESPFGSIILGEGQSVTGIELTLSPTP